MKYFIAGGLGFVGSNFVRGLIGGEYGENVEKVLVCDSFTYAANLENLNTVINDPRLLVFNSDIRDYKEIDSIMQGVDIVVNFAAESHVDRSIGSNSIFFETNTLGARNLMDVSMKKGVSVFLQVSTDEVYGSINSGSWTEESPLLPNSPYAASKASADLIARSYYQTYGFDVRITRCSNNFGPYQYPEKIIPLFVTNIIRGKKVPVYGDGLNIREWIHVDDHCRGIDLTIKNGEPGEVYNIGASSSMNNIDLTMYILSYFGYGEEMVEYVEDRKGHDRRYSVNWSKIYNNLDYGPKKSIKENLGQTIDWYINNKEWWDPIISGLQK